MFRLLLTAVAVLALASPVVARDRLTVDPDSPYFLSDTDQAAADPNENFSLRGSIGAASIVAHEHVYAGASDNLSLLVWESTVPSAKIDVKARFPDAWTLRGHFDGALFGTSKMTDYDWIPPHNTGFGMNDWSDRSISPNTNLDWYLNADIALGRDLPISEALTVNVNGGFKYTDVEWTAIGGSYIYSDGGFRNDVGTFPNTPGIRYRQQIPTVFAGVDAIVNDGPWNLEAGARAGLIIYGQSVDHHYMREPPEYITDNLTLGQVLSADAKLGFAIGDHLGLFVEGSYEKMFAGHTMTDYRQISNNALLIHSNNIGGAELDVASLMAGLKGNF
ncbi:MAG: omptin family outer membrane protease [Devosia sp.]